MKENHPPVPPNCEFFEFNPVAGYGWFFKIKNDRGTDVVYLDGVATNYAQLASRRKLIAMVSSCAWLDEVERIQNLTKGTRQPYAPGHTEAIQNAEAWKKWGLS